METKDISRGCEFCNNYDFSQCATEIDKYGARINLACGSYHYPAEEQFNYCPQCGRKLSKDNKEK